MTFFKWSKTAASNSNADATINWAEGQAPSSVNDSARAVMAAAAKYRDDTAGVVTAGTSTAYTLTTNQVFTTLALLSGQTITIIPHATSGASPTLNVDGLGAKAINSATGVAVATGALVSGTPYTLTYLNASTEFILNNVVATVPASATVAGIVELATDAETITGTDTGRATTPANIAAVLAAFVPPYPRGYIDGCVLANNASDATNDIDISAGACRDSTNGKNIVVAAMTKQLDANWVAGTGAGMRNSAVGISNGTYHIYAVSKADGTQDFYAHTSTTVATVITALQAEPNGSAYVYARRIGSIIRASSAIVGFVQDGDRFIRVNMATDHAASAASTNAISRALSVPLGLRVRAIMTVNASISGAGTTYILVTDLSTADVVPTVSVNTVRVNASSSDGDVSAEIEVMTNTSGEVRTRIDSTGFTYYLLTKGWVDARGKDAA